jgi:hypothetical protein
MPSKMQQSRVQIVNRGGLLGGFIAEVVSGSDNLPAFDSGAGHPDGLRAGQWNVASVGVQCVIGLEIIVSIPGVHGLIAVGAAFIKLDETHAALH